MKKLALSLLGALSMLLSGGSAYAQSVHIRATIPFQFSVNNKILPAGQYDVLSTDGSIGRLEIRDSRGPLMFVSTLDRQTSSVSDQTKLVFRQYGNAYFLSQLWTAGSRAGLEVQEPPSMIREAKMHAKEVTVAAKE